MKVTLKNKKEVDVNLYKLSIAEIRGLLEVKKDKDDPYSREDTIVSKACGMSVKELQALPFPDYRKILNAFWACIRDPLKDDGEEKNLASESI